MRQLAMDFPESRGFLREDSLRSIAGTNLGIAFTKGKSVVVPKADLMSDQEILGTVRSEGIQSGLALPLISRNRTLGVLTLARRTEDTFGPDDIDFLMRAAGQVAIAVENALAYREIAELRDKLAQEKLYLEEEIRTAGALKES